MKTRTIICCLLLGLAAFKNGYAQKAQVYIDSVNAYVKYVDSLIADFSVNPVCEASVTKASAHFSKPGKTEWCGSAELFSDGKTESLYRLSYSNSCDSATLLQDYYFYNNKIVLIRTVDFYVQHTPTDQYYFNDSHIDAFTGKSYLDEGYELLKKVSK
jgi:hypothetical protein